MFGPLWWAAGLKSLAAAVGCVNSIALQMNTLGGQRESFARASTLAELGGLH